MTADRKKGKYTYDRCTAFHGKCGNARAIRLRCSLMNKNQPGLRVTVRVTFCGR